MNNEKQDNLMSFFVPVSRRQAREIALRILYALELSGNSLLFTLGELHENEQPDKELAQFIDRLIIKTYETREETDELIRNRSANWKFERIAIIDRIVMRIAISEILHFFDIPPKVSIDEAIELSKQYSTEKSSSYINGVLDGVYEDLKRENRIIKKGRGCRDTHARKQIKKNFPHSNNTV